MYRNVRRKRLPTKLVIPSHRRLCWRLHLQTLLPGMFQCSWKLEFAVKLEGVRNRPSAGNDGSHNKTRENWRVVRQFGTLTSQTLNPSAWTTLLPI